MEWINHYDEETGLEVEIPQIIDKTKPAGLEDVIKGNEHLIFNMILSAAEFGILNKLPHVAFMALNDLIFTVKESQYKDKLIYCQQYFANPDLEQYEKCANIDRLLKLLASQ